MKFIKIRMHSDNGLITLTDILQSIPSNTVPWRIIELERIGSLPSGQGMRDFEIAIRNMPEGLLIDWGNLVRLAEGVEQVWNGLFIGLGAGFVFERQKILAQDFEGCEFVIEAFDSYEWTLGFQETSSTAS